MRQLTTSVSDGVLVWSILYFLYQVFWTNFFACLGMSVQGAAAAVGVFRFAQNRPASSVYDAHQILTWLAQVVVSPLLAVAFCHKDLPVMMNFNMMAMMGVLLASRFMAPGPRQMANDASNGLAIVTILLVCLRSFNIYGLLAVGLYIVAGKVIGSEGKMSIFLRVDVLHIDLAIANVLFAWAFLNL